MAKWPNGDVRNYVQAGLLDNTNQITPINTLDDLLEYFKDLKSKNDISSFECISKNGFIKNKLNDYMDWLQDDIRIVKLSRDQALRFYGRPNFLANHLYGNPGMGYIILMLNEFNHPSEMNFDVLVNGSIKVLGKTGIAKLNKIIKLFERVDTIEGNGSMYGEEL